MLEEMTQPSAGAAFSRRLLLAGPLLGLAACAGSASRSPFFSTLLNFRRPANPIDLVKAEALPYASMLAFFKGGAKSILVLGEYLPQGRLVWYSAERQSLTTWGPFVLKLLGTDIGLRETTLSGQWETDIRRMIGRPVGRTLDYRGATNQATVATKSRFELGSMEKVDNLGKIQTLRRVREHVTANKYHFYSNDYWIDAATGFCWKSRQVVIPTMPPLNTQIIKAPRGA